MYLRIWTMYSRISLGPTPGVGPTRTPGDTRRLRAGRPYTTPLPSLPPPSPPPRSQLEVMFGTFDLGGTGRINVNQTNQAIKMTVGEEASLLMDEGNHVSKDEFVETCRKSLGKF